MGEGEERCKQRDGEKDSSARREDVLFLLWEDNGAHLSDRVMSSVRGECVIFFPPSVHGENARA